MRIAVPKSSNVKHALTAATAMATQVPIRVRCLGAESRSVMGDANPQVGSSVIYKMSGVTATYTAIDQTTPIAAVGARGTRGSSSTNTVAGSVTTTAAAQRVAGFFMEKSSTSSSVTDPAGTTRRGVAFTTGGGAVSSLIVDEEIVSAGATGTRTATYNVSSSVGYGLLVAITDGAPPPGSVTHGWVGANTTGGFQVVAKLAAATSVRLAVSTNSGMTSPVYVSAEVPDVDGYVRLAITGLTAGTAYWWQLADTPSGGNESLIGSVGKASTLPSGNASFTFAFAACQTNNNADSAALDAIRAWDPLLFVHTGDLHYRDPASTDPDVHRSYIEAQIVGAGGLAQLLREVPTYYTRSDHDTAGDNSDTNTDIGLASIAAYRQVVPHPPLADPLADSLHYSFVCGRVRFIVLDIRNHDRSTGADAQSPSKTMLGSAQKQWLLDELLEAEPVKVIVSDVGWIGTASLTQGTDKWWAYDNERAEIGAYIVAQGLFGRVVMLTGDNHALLSDDGTNNLWGGFPVWGAAPLANISGGRYLDDYQQKYSPFPQEDVRNYGRVTVTDAGTSITLSFSGWDAVNGVERVNGELVVDLTDAATLAGESDAATAFAKVKRKAIAQALAAESATTSMKRKTKAIASSAEVDLSQGLTRYERVTIGNSLEGDLSTLLSKTRRYGLSSALEYDRAFLFTRYERVTLSSGFESDTATTLDSQKTKAIASSLEENEATILTMAFGIGITGAEEENASGALSHRRIFGLALVSSDELASTLAIVKAKLTVQSVEYDNAKTVGSSAVYGIDRAVESDGSLSFLRRKLFTSAQSLESNSAPTFAPRKVEAIVSAIESDSAGITLRLKLRSTARSIEDDVASIVNPSSVYSLDRSTESDSAEILSKIAIRAISLSAEEDLAGSLGSSVLIDIGSVVEIDLSTVVTSVKFNLTSQAKEFDFSQALDFQKNRSITSPIEIDIARSLLSSQLGILGLAIEIDGATTIYRQFGIFDYFEGSASAIDFSIGHSSVNPNDVAGGSAYVELE